MTCTRLRMQVTDDLTQSCGKAVYTHSYKSMTNDVETMNNQQHEFSSDVDLPDDDRDTCTKSRTQLNIGSNLDTTMACNCMYIFQLRTSIVKHHMSSAHPHAGEIDVANPRPQVNWSQFKRYHAASTESPYNYSRRNCHMHSTARSHPLELMSFSWWRHTFTRRKRMTELPEHCACMQGHQ